MKKILYLCLFIGALIQSYANTDYPKVFATNTSINLKYVNSCQLQDSSFVFLGKLNPLSSSNNYFVMHLSSNVSLLSKVQLFDTTSIYVNIAKVVATTDTGYILVGNSISKYDSVAYLFCIKYNLLGDTLWNRAFVLDSIHFPVIADAIVTADAGILIVANDYPSDTSNHVILVKIDATGTSSQIRSLNTHGLSSIRATQVLEPTTGAFTIMGRAILSTSSFIIKMATIDSVEWYKLYPNIFNAGFIHKNNSYYMVGNNIGYYNLFVQLDEAGNTVFIKKYDYTVSISTNNNIQHLLDLNDSFYVYSTVYDLFTDNNYYRGSYIIDTLGNVRTIFNTNGQVDALLGKDNNVRLIHQGPLIGLKTTFPYEHIGVSIYSNDSTSDPSYCYFLSPYPSTISTDGIPVANLSLSIDTLGIMTKYALMYDSIHIEEFNACISTFGGVGAEVNVDYINLYPNPTNGLSTIQNEGDILKDANIIIYDALGKEQYTHTSDIATNISLDLQFLQNGMYYYSIISQNNIVKQGKFVLLK